MDGRASPRTCSGQPDAASDKRCNSIPAAGGDRNLRRDGVRRDAANERVQHSNADVKKGSYNVGVDIFNLISNAVLTYNQTFVPNGTWLQPLSVMTPRFVKIGAQIDF